MQRSILPFSLPQTLACFAVILFWLFPAEAAQTPATSKAPEKPSVQAQGMFTIEADTQRQAGKISYADGNVDIHYQNVRLRADHAEYNDDTHVAMVRGHVQLDYVTQHVEATDGDYNIQTGRGTFHNVRATYAVQRKPQPALLISPNPIYVRAAVAERLNPDTYQFRDAWVTVCDPDRPTWKFYTSEATVQVQRTVHLENADFRILSVPILYLPYATLPAARQRNSGFLIPEMGNSSTKGYFFGDSYYWAPKDWMDATLGGTYLSLRGWSQNAELRMRPWENVKLDATYFGVVDRGLHQTNAPPLKEGGHEMHFDFDAFLAHGWRAVADLNELSSLTFQLAFSPTLSQALNSEVRNTAFLSNNFNGFSLDFSASSYKDFLSTSPEAYIDLRTAPEVRFDSVDQAPFRHLPLYFSFDSFMDGVHRNDNVTNFDTGALVGRMELAPSATMPLHFGAWLDFTPSFTARTTRYGAQLENGVAVNQPFVRATGEATIDVRPPTLDRVWHSRKAKWKHSIEPDFVYRYVTGVDDFDRIIRFDEDDTLTDTNEIQYGITQRLFRKDDGGDTQELVSWSLTQKYFFDPTFGGAFLPGVRNVFESLDELTPFAFAEEPVNFSPVISDLRVTPGGRYDTQFIVDYDPKLGRANAIGTLMKVKPYRQSFLTLAEFSVDNLPPTIAAPNFLFQGRSNQIRAIWGWGDMNKPGWDSTMGVTYDFEQKLFEEQLVQVGYNSSCCGFGLEYERLSLGPVREENRYGFVLRIANIGSAGNIRRQERIF